MKRNNQLDKNISSELAKGMYSGSGIVFFGKAIHSFTNFSGRVIRGTVISGALVTGAAHYTLPEENPGRQAADKTIDAAQFSLGVGAQIINQVIDKTPGTKNDWKMAIEQLASKVGLKLDLDVGDAAPNRTLKTDQNVTKAGKLGFTPQNKQ